MMSAPTIPSTAPVLDPRDQPRLRSKPKAPTTGWVNHRLGEWGHNPSKISCGGGVVRLERHRNQHANTVGVLAPGQRLTLLVVAPEASAPTAHAVLMAAGRRGNTDDLDTLLQCRPIATEVLGRSAQP
jgi:hypothetical protein